MRDSDRTFVHSKNEPQISYALSSSIIFLLNVTYISPLIYYMVWRIEDNNIYILIFLGNNFGWYTKFLLK